MEGLIILAVSGSVVWAGDQNNLLVNPAEGLELSVKGTVCGPHYQDPIIRLQEFQEFGEVFF